LGASGPIRGTIRELFFSSFIWEIQESCSKAKKLLALHPALDKLPVLPATAATNQPTNTHTHTETMKKTLTTAQAAHLIDDANANWSRAGAFALVEYLEEIEESTGEGMELDVVAIRCDFSEYSSLIEWASDYCGDDWKAEIGIDGDADEEDVDDAIRDFITYRGTLIEFVGGIIVSSF
jgi:hypothetical protein